MPASTVASDRIPSVSPATGETLSWVDATPPEQIASIVARGRAAQKHWAKRSIKHRCSLLNKLREQMFATRDALADVVVRESGKPRPEALFSDIFVSLDTAGYLATNAGQMLAPEHIQHHNIAAKAKTGELRYEPLGVIGIISSWNYPLAIPLGQIIPAVVAGNAVVCKTSDFTPQCGALIEKLFVDSGFPKDLVTVIQGGAEVGRALIAATADKILFTGSVETGRRVAEACASRLIPTVLELGGKDAMIVLADANLDIASSGAVWGSFTNCGQVCLSVERIFVEQTAAEKFAALCVEKTKKLRLGPGSDPSTDVGPLIRPQHVQRMTDLIEDAVTHGAKVLCGGNPRPDMGPNFFEPTVILDVDSASRLFQEETFGPVLAIQRVADAEEAVTRANDSRFALAASVWTVDTARGRAIAARLRAGSVMINDAISYYAIAEAPHGGCGLSGWGRAHGKTGLLEMVQTKYIDIDRTPGRAKPWWFRYGADLERAADAFLQFQYANTLGARLRNARAALKTIFRDHGL
ncbi:MAG TPA: aldehyde dehydrogenase family protein [Candidatus Sulfotelmatobacter sp.]|nr:aldehyde dehydrogenase family protein [Candidatus Sulfotelmatobacter sp.]